MDSALVLARGVRKSFGAVEVLRGVDLTVPSGSVTCLIGASGSGKTTFLRCINQLESIDGGFIKVNGRIVGAKEVRGRLVELTPQEQAERRAEIGMVFQQFNLFPHMTVLQNMMEAPVRVKKEDSADVRTRALELLDRVGLASRAGDYPNVLSGGQQQRVAIARALNMRPKLMLFDEPTSALDPEITGEVLDVMLNLARDGMTMIVVTHEIGFAREAATNIVFMADGVVADEGTTTEMLGSPRSARLREFLRKVD